MRTFGLILIVAGVAGFYYCSQQLANLQPLPAEYSVEDSLRTDRGKMEAGRFLSAGGVIIGLLFVVYPQGR